MSTTITTNHHARELLSYSQMPRDDESWDEPAVPLEQEDDNYRPRYFRAYGSWWNVDEFVRIYRNSQPSPPFSHSVADDSPLLTWDGICTTSHGTAIVVRYPDEDYDTVVVGFVTITG